MVTTEQIAALLDEMPGPARTWAVGNDLVSLPVFRLSCTPLFIRRVFTPEELAYCARFSEPMLRYASTWAAKEAVYKALKQVDADVRLWWRDIGISRDKPAGKPTASIRKMPDLQCSLTVSHDGEMVWAVAVCALKRTSMF